MLRCLNPIALLKCWWFEDEAEPGMSHKAAPRPGPSHNTSTVTSSRPGFWGRF